ncbi:MAG: hypothetical protein ACR2O4_07065 [Hyphomicrobiaceae bacterium]
MVAIDQYNTASGGRSFGRIITGFFRGVLRDLAYPVIMYRHLRGIEVAEQTSKRAAKPKARAVEVATGPALLTATEAMARLHTMTVPAISIADNVTQVSQSADSGLDWVSYELAAIRRDIADYLPG